MKATSKIDVDEDKWAPCEPGALLAFAASDRQRRRSQFFAKLGGISIMLLMGTLGYIAATSNLTTENVRSQDILIGGISCTDVQANKVAFQADDVSPDTKAKILAHLKECSHCRSLWPPVEHHVNGSGNDRLMAFQFELRR